MIKNREGYLISETERECTKCRKIFKKTSKTVTLCNQCNSERVKSTDERQKMVQRAKGRAKKKNIEFSIKSSDIEFPEFCPILGVKLEHTVGRSGGGINSPALDRINPKIGYTKNNVRVISHLANMMKSCATEQEMVTFAKWVLSEFSGQD